MTVQQRFPSEEIDHFIEKTWSLLLTAPTIPPRLIERSMRQSCACTPPPSSEAGPTSRALTGRNLTAGLCSSAWCPTGRRGLDDLVVIKPVAASTATRPSAPKRISLPKRVGRRLGASAQHSPVPSRAPRAAAEQAAEAAEQAAEAAAAAAAEAAAAGSSAVTGHVHPISFAYPTSRYERYRRLRAQPKVWAEHEGSGFSRVVPGRAYGFQREADYMAEYASSFYAVTYRKAGWDCLRHLEILAAGALPYFVDLDLAPELTLHTFPKALVLRAMQLPGVPSQAAVRHAIKHGLPIRLNRSTFDAGAYHRLRRSVLAHFESRMLTRSLPAQALIVPGAPSSHRLPRIYMSSARSNGTDYLRDMMLIGLLEQPGRFVVHTNFDASHLFDDYPPAAAAALYGRGFTYTRALSAARRTQLEHTACPKAGGGSGGGSGGSGGSGGGSERASYDHLIVTTQSNEPAPCLALLRAHGSFKRAILLDGNDDGAQEILADAQGFNAIYRREWAPPRAASLRASLWARTPPARILRCIANADSCSTWVHAADAVDPWLERWGLTCTCGGLCGLLGSPLNTRAWLLLLAGAALAAAAARLVRRAIFLHALR